MLGDMNQLRANCEFNVCEWRQFAGDKFISFYTSKTFSASENLKLFKFSITSDVIDELRSRE